VAKKKSSIGSVGDFSYLTSNLAQDPSPVGQDERDAVAKVEEHKAAVAARKPVRGLHGGAAAFAKKPKGEPVFASALDALDHIAGGYVGGLIEPPTSGEAVKRRLLSMSPAAFLASKVLPDIEPPKKGTMTGGGARGGGAPVTTGLKQKPIPFKEIVESPLVGGPTIAAAPFVAKGIRAVGDVVGKAPIGAEVLSFSPLGGAITIGVSKLAEEYPDSAVGKLIVDKKSGKAPTIADQQEFFMDIASRPNRYVDVSARDKTIMAGISPGTAAIAQLSIDGANPPMLQSAADQNADFFLSPVLDTNLKKRASKLKWDVSRWDALTPGEKMYQAYNENSYLTTTLRNVVMAVGATASAPAGVKALVEGIANAPKDDGAALKLIAEGMVQPYQQAADVTRRDGLSAGLLTAFRDNPVDFALATMSAARGAGRLVGATSRTGIVGKVGGRAPGVVGRAARGAEEFAAVNRPVLARRTGVESVSEVPLVPPAVKPVRAGESVIDALRRREEEAARIAVEAESARAAGLVNAEGVPIRVVRQDVAPPAIIGYTGPNIASPIGLAASKWIAERSSWWLDRLERRAGRAYTRREANVAQGIGVQIENTLSRALGRFPTDIERQRAAFELTWAKEILSTDAEGNPIRVTPGLIADYYRGKIDELEANPRFVASPTKKQQAQVALWRSAESDWRAIDGVKLDAKVVDDLRAAAAPLKDESDKLIAAALGESLTEAKRGNYIRMLVIDPGFKAAARELKAEKNVLPRELDALQRRIRSNTRRLAEKSKTTGYGSKSAPKSRARYAELRREIVDDLRSAERVALQLGDRELADQYRSVRERVVLARVASRDEAARIASEIEGVESLRVPVGALPVEAQAPYTAALAASRALPGAEVRAVEALGGVATTRGKGFARTPSQRDIGVAENAVADARAQLASVESFPTPDAASVAGAREALRVAEERLVGLRAAAGEAATVTALRSQVESGVTEAKRILEQGRTVLSTSQVQAAIDASGDFAGVRVFKKKDYSGWYTIDRAQGEVLDEFIARVEANDQGAMLHLVQKGDILKMDRIEIVGPKKINTGPRGGIRGGRFLKSEGKFFAMGAEDTQNMWKNLMFDTTELIAADTWRRKMQQLIELTGVRVTVGQKAIDDARANAERIVATNKGITFDAAFERELELALNRSYEFRLGDFKVLNPGSPDSELPPERVFVGTAAEGIDPDSVAGLMWKEINARTIDPNAPSDYFVIPRAVYDGIQDSLRAESFSFKPSARKGFGGVLSPYNADRLTRAWRTLTLNVLPKTAFANITGSATLAMIGGAGPRAWYYAWKALRSGGEDLAIPRELQQRYFDPLTAKVSGKTRGAAIAASWVNWMRKLNSSSEDFGRLAVWYSKAYPEAMKQSTGNAFMWRAKGLNDDAKRMIDAMANDAPEWRALNQAWMQKSFDFLGDLHRGGEFASKLRIAIPFWQWYAHMLKLTFLTMPRKYPGRALMLQQLGEIGDEYQKTHGVIIPWGEDLIPLFTGESVVGGQPQWVTTAITTSNWYPFATVGSVASRTGEPNLVGYIRGAANPIAMNTFLTILSAGLILKGGSAVEYSDYNGVKAAKNEFGNEITSVRSADFLNYVANKLGMAVPLSPTIMSQASRSDTSTLWNQTDAAKKGPQIEKKRYDLLSALDDPWSGTALGFVARAMFGVQLSEVPGIGPVERARLVKMYRNDIRKAQVEQANITRILIEQNQPVPGVGGIYG